MSKPWKLLEKLGRGAMGEVYKAQDPYLPRFVAIKILRPELASQEFFVERFMREAAVAATLNHPNIVTLHGVEEFGGTWRIIMEYVQGMSLAQLVSRFGPQKPRYALEIIKHAANALSCAHAQSVVHRDIKPHNILLSDAGVVKVTDFGLAKVLFEDSNLTKPGELVGTPRYMSPEQVNGEPLTPQTDIYSLGVVLYELIAGKPVYDVTDPLLIMRRIADAPFPDIRKVAPQTNPEVAKILAKMTAKDPAERYPDARALANDLQEFRALGKASLAHGIELRDMDAVIVESPPEPGVESSSEILLHHAVHDEDRARWISRELESSGFKVRRCPLGVAESDSEIRRLIESGSTARRVVPVISPAYIENAVAMPLILDSPPARAACLPPIVVRSMQGSAPAWLRDCLDISDLPEPVARESLVRWAAECVARKGDPAASSTRGRVPQVFSVPEGRATLFMGRGNLIDEIRVRLRQFGGVTLCPSRPGSAGSGVSSLAIEFARANAGNYSHVWWVRANSSETLSADYSSICNGLGLPESVLKSRQLRSKAVKRWLGMNNRWLIIFDGVRSPKRIASLLPQKLSGDVIVVSATSSWPKAPNRIAVPPFDRREALEFLAQRAKRPADDAANPLCELLCDMPLALRLAAAYCNYRNLSFQEYADLFRERHSILGKDKAGRMPLRAATRTAFSLALELIAGESPETHALLSVSAYCCADAIPIDLIRNHPSVFERPDGRNGEPVAREAAFELLVRLGVLEGTPAQAFLHELLQEFLIEWLEAALADEPIAARRAILGSLRGEINDADAAEWVRRGVAFATDALAADPKSESRSADVGRVLPHARMLAKQADRLHVSAAERGELWRRIATHLVELADPEGAARAFTSALAALESVLGRRHERIARIYRELGELRAGQRDLRGALECFYAALEIDRVIKDRPGKDRAALHRALGDISFELGDHTRARSNYEEALHIDFGLDGSCSVDIGSDYLALGRVLEFCGFLPAAWEHYTHALENFEGIYGDNHETVATSVRALAALHQKSGELVEARHFYKRVLSIRVALHGELQADVASDYENLAAVEVGLGMPTMARENFAKALSITRSLYGEGDLRVAVLHRRIGATLQSQGHPREAYRHYLSAMQIFERTLGADDHQTRAVGQEIEALSARLGDLPPRI